MQQEHLTNKNIWHKNKTYLLKAALKSLKHIVPVNNPM